MNAEEPSARTISDARELRALAHPLRIELLELLIREGHPMTATECAEVVGHSPANCSFHLRTLARYGFVEEVGGGRGRQRPWRAVGSGVRLDEFSHDPEMNLAAGELLGMLVQRDIARMRDWFSKRATGDPAWREAGFGTNALIYLTSEELDEFEQRVNGFLEQHSGRGSDPTARPEGARPVSVMAFGFPLDPTPSGS